MDEYEIENRKSVFLQMMEESKRIRVWLSIFITISLHKLFLVDDILWNFDLRETVSVLKGFTFISICISMIILGIVSYHTLSIRKKYWQQFLVLPLLCVLVAYGCIEMNSQIRFFAPNVPRTLIFGTIFLYVISLFSKKREAFFTHFFHSVVSLIVAYTIVSLVSFDIFLPANVLEFASPILKTIILQGLFILLLFLFCYVKVFEKHFYIWESLLCIPIFFVTSVLNIWVGMLETGWIDANIYMMYNFDDYSIMPGVVVFLVFFLPFYSYLRNN